MSHSYHAVEIWQLAAIAVVRTGDAVEMFLGQSHGVVGMKDRDVLCVCAKTFHN